jgi:hypothetical protein
MNIKNYTSSVSVDRSVSDIEHCLVAAGASHIAKAYDQSGNVQALIFQMPNEKGEHLTFKLPARWQKVFDKMWKQVRRPRKETHDRVMEQAKKTAWKLLYDQVAVQTSNILIEQQDSIEAFFPYLYDGRRDKTIYEIAKGNGFKQLTMGKE